MQALRKLLGPIWLLATLILLALGTWQALFVAPTEATMGHLQRIFYYHVPINIAAEIFPYVNLIASIAFLYFRKKDQIKALPWDALAQASAEVTVVYCSLGLATGMIWAKPAWGVWWAWDERLTTFLLLWLLYVSYLLVRRFSQSGQSAVLAAVISIFAGVDVPIVYMSIRWWRTQHPAPVFGGGADSGLDKAMWPAFALCAIGWLMWGIFLIGFRYNTAKQELDRRLEEELEFAQ